MIVFREAKREEAKWLSSRLRPEDAREIQTATGKDPDVILPMSFDISRVCYTIRYSTREGLTDKDPLAIFGVADDPTNPNKGVVWMLATPRVQKVWLALMKIAPAWLDRISSPYAEGLHNIVDARNTLHIRWLQKTGFKPKGSLIQNGHKFLYVTRPGVTK